jgi:hypothetical protein
METSLLSWVIIGMPGLLCLISHQNIFCLQCDMHFEVGILQADPTVPTMQASVCIPQRALFA